MDTKWVQYIRKDMEGKSTGELLKIWEENNRAGYLEETFEAIKQLLMERGIALPAQKENVENNLANRGKEPQRKKRFFDTPFDINNVFTKDFRQKEPLVLFGAVIGIFVASPLMGYSRLLNGILGAISGIIGGGIGYLLWIVFGKK